MLLRVKADSSLNVSVVNVDGFIDRWCEVERRLFSVQELSRASS